MSQASIAATYRRPGRPGIRQSDVDRAADALLRAGKKPTIEAVRARTGGSTQSLMPMLERWWQRLFARMQLAEPAFQKLPGALPELAEAFFLCAVDEAAKVAAAQKLPEQELLQGREQNIEVRVHALRLAEEALRERHAMHARELETLHSQLREVTLLLRKSQASRDALEQRVHELSAALGARAGRGRPQVTKQRSKSAKARQAATAAASKAPRRKASVALQRKRAPAKQARRR